MTPATRATDRRATLRGVYAIADAALLGPYLTEACGAALEGGARLIQYRDKSDDAGARLRQAQRLKDVCLRFRVPLIINDDVELARRVAAQGVHLGEHDALPEMAREALGEQAVIGVSCYNSLERARAAAAAGADYVAFGSVFPSNSKPAARRAPLELLKRADATVPLPLCAIGGIHIDNADAAVAAGADMIAVINGIFGQRDIVSATRELAALFRTKTDI